MAEAEANQHPNGVDVPTAEPSRRRAWFRRSWWVLWVVGLALLFTPALSASQHKIGPGVVKVSVAPAWHGSMTLSFPPLGRVNAATHRGPSHVTVELRELDVQPVISGGGRIDMDTLTSQVRGDLPGVLRSVALRIALAGALVGAAAVLVLPRRSVLRVVAGMLIGSVAASAVVAVTLVGFDPMRFEEPVYEGPIAAGASVLTAITSGEHSGLDARLDVLAARVAELYSAGLTADIADSGGDVSILHVSDIHLNPVGVVLTRQVAGSFGVDAIVDTGDTTSFGLPLEEPFSGLFSDFGVPYYFVAGNHDSRANRRAMAAAPGVTPIDGRVVDVHGVKILGFDDPVVTSTRDVSRGERAQVMKGAEPEMRALVSQNHPDVLATHNPVMASAVAGSVPLVIAGHLHKTVLTAEDGTVIAVVGSTGATGLGSLTVETDLPYEAQILRFRRGRLVAIDNIELMGTSGDFEVRRTLISAELRDSDPDSIVDSDPDERPASSTTVPTSSTAPTTSTAGAGSGGG